MLLVTFLQSIECQSVKINFKGKKRLWMIESPQLFITKKITCTFYGVICVQSSLDLSELQCWQPVLNTQYNTYKTRRILDESNVSVLRFRYVPACDKQFLDEIRGFSIENHSHLEVCVHPKIIVHKYRNMNYPMIISLLAESLEI